MIETLNDCVILPHVPNWAHSVHVNKRWPASNIVASVRGGEDRTTGGLVPYIRQEWHTLPFTVQERARLNARLQEALRKGRACCPYFARAQYLARPAALRWEMHPSIGDAALVSGLIAGHRYYYDKGPYDLRLVNTLENELTESGEFIAKADVVVVFMTQSLAPGTVRPADAHAVSGFETEGLWQWKPGDYAFFLRRDAQGRENRSVLIDVGAEAAAEGWELDGPYVAGGSSITTASAVGRAGVTGYPAPAEGVYQSARALTGANPEAAITCTIEGLHLGVDCNVRLHFAEIEPGIDGTTGRRVFDVLVNGALVAADVEPYAMAGYWLNRAVCLDALVQPDHLGKITITLRPRRRLEVFAVSYFQPVNPAMPLHVLDSVMVPAGALVLLKDQPDPVQNGLYQVGEDHTLTRATCADTGRKLEVLTAIYASNGIGNGAKTFRCSNAGKITLGTSEIAFEEILPDAQYRAGLNAVEFYQYTWEIVELAEGSGPNLLRFETPMKGYYPDGNQVYPVLFGTPRCSGIEAITNHLAHVKLSVEEPIGMGDLGQPGQCPVEVCIADPAIPFPVPPDVPMRPSTDYSPLGTVWEPFYERDDGTSRPTGYNPETVPPTGLWDGVLDKWAADVWAKWEAFKEAENLHPTAEVMFWAPHAGGLRWWANPLFGIEPPELTSAAEWEWTIAIDFTV